MQRIRQGSTCDVPCRDLARLLESFGFTVRTDRNNHMIAYHPRLKECPHFPTGTFGVNCHTKQGPGIAHVAAVKDAARAISFIECL